MTAILVTTSLSVILVDNLADVLSAGQQSTTPRSASALSSPNPRMPSTMRTNPGVLHRTPGMSSGTRGTLRSVRQLKVRKAKVRDPSRKASTKERVRQGQSGSCP